MRIFLAGGTGVLGTRLIPKLTAAGHQVTRHQMAPDAPGPGRSSPAGRSRAWRSRTEQAMDRGCAGNLQPRRGRLAV